MSNLTKVIDFLREHDTLDSINAVVREAELAADLRIKEVERIAKEQNVVMAVNDSATIASDVQDATGIYAHPAYKSEFQMYTTMFTGWHMLFYAIRDSIGQNDYYSLINGVINMEKGFIKCSKKISTYMAWGEIKIKKEYANGAVEYWLSPEFSAHILDVRWIQKFFAERM
jgi:hypothetical protein